MTTRRDFLKNTVLVGAGITFSLSSRSVWAFSPNATVNVAIIGTGGRAHAIAQSIGRCTGVKLVQACDVDELALNKFMAYAEKQVGHPIGRERDFRKLLENKSLDAVVITTPEHWHAPMAIMAMQAGKHVYVEKPCSHNLAENELLINAQKKYDKVCQMGNQQRSAATSIKAIKDIRDGKIGEVYFAKSWYANTRGSIGTGKKIAVPNTLNWDLWQGPAPREAYRDNVHPYNWHWFRTWGTGEIHNNGTHEIDICRWALGATFPKRVVSTGGRLHFKDDWQYFDTQEVSYEFENGKTLVWEGRSCNGMRQYGRGRGAILHGTKGTILLDREGVEMYDLGGKMLERQEEQVTGTSANTSDTSGFDYLTVLHFQNFVNAISTGEVLRAPIADGAISTHLCHLGNLAQDLKVSLEIDPQTGKVVNNRKAMEKWGRAYEKGWAPKL